MERMDVRVLGTEPVTVRWTGSADALGLEAEPEFTTPISVEAVVRQAGPRILVTGSAATTLSLTCSRCLEVFPAPVTAEIAIEFREGPPPAETDDPEGGNNADVSWFEPPWLDLADDVRQILLVAVPGFPVCREACRGLCPVCGANRNEAACGHPDAPEAPGLSLGALVDKERGSHG